MRKLSSLACLTDAIELVLVFQCHRQDIFKIKLIR